MPDPFRELLVRMECTTILQKVIAVWMILDLSLIEKHIWQIPTKFVYPWNIVTFKMSLEDCLEISVIEIKINNPFILSKPIKLFLHKFNIWRFYNLIYSWINLTPKFTICWSNRHFPGYLKSELWYRSPLWDRSTNLIFILLFTFLKFD